jgi:hypothetical protein
MKAVTEAVSHKGPSIVIAYAPCINHGIKAGMNNVEAEMKKAVAYNPCTVIIRISLKNPSLWIISSRPAPTSSAFPDSCILCYSSPANRIEKQQSRVNFTHVWLGFCREYTWHIGITGTREPVALKYWGFPAFLRSYSV